jgi:putative tryptophan/tyrosine transport system substrate-binding protein
MRRRQFIIVIGSMAAGSLLRLRVVRAQEPGRLYRLGVMTGAARAAARMVGFLDELKVLGFVEGQNLKIVAGGFDVRDDQFAEVAATLTKAAPDALFCVGDSAARAASESAHSVPIVALSPDLVAAGLAHSLAHPGGNITGVSLFGGELNGKRQDILLEAVPATRRMAALADPTVSRAAELDVLQKAARARGVELAVFTARTPEQIAPAVDQAKASGATALNVLDAPLFSFNRHVVIEQAAAFGLPAIYQFPEMAEEGGLIAYGVRIDLVYRQAAHLLAKVLRGAKPGDLPIEQPTNFILVINLRTARTLGLTIPETLLLRADKLIE